MLRNILKGGKFDGNLSPFDKVNGLWDVRGIQIDLSQPISNCVFVDTDFSYASFRALWFENCTFQNVLFDHADLSQISDHGNRFINCSFNRSRLNGAAFGYRGTEFIDCIFEKTVFKRSIFIRPKFNGCSFCSCDLKGVDLNGASFEGCMFEGKLVDVWFRGGFPLASDAIEFGEPRKNKMLHVDLRKATFWGVHFSNGCDLSTVHLPIDGQHRLYSKWWRRLKTAEEVMETWSGPEKEAGLIFVRSHLVHARDQEFFILNRMEMVEEYGLDLADKILMTLETADD